MGQAGASAACQGSAPWPEFKPKPRDYILSVRDQTPKRKLQFSAEVLHLGGAGGSLAG